VTQESILCSFGNFKKINIYIVKCLEKRCRGTIESRLNDIQCGFRPGRSTTDQISLSSKFLKNLGSMQKRLHMLCRPEKAYDWVPRETICCGVFREYGVDSRLLLAVKSLYS